MNRLQQQKLIEIIKKKNGDKSPPHQQRIIDKIMSDFTESEELRCIQEYYDFITSGNEFDFDLVWKWLEITTKKNAMNLLEKHFKNEEEKDYKIRVKDGRIKETIMLTNSTFKLFCFEAKTKKSTELYKCCFKLNAICDTVLRELHAENSNLNATIQGLNNAISMRQFDLKLQREQFLIQHFPENVQCIYYGEITNTSGNNRLIKFGKTNNLEQRVKQHKQTYANFYLCNAFRVQNSTHVENLIKNHSLLKPRIQSIFINSKEYTELISMVDLSFPELDKIIKDIICSIEYTPEQIMDLINTNTSSRETIRALTSQLNDANNTISNLNLLQPRNR